MEDYKGKYENLMERLRKAKVDNNVYDERYCCVIDDIVPELKESEDERMIQYFKDLAPFDKADELYEKYGFSHKDAIAWLEKKGDYHKGFRDGYNSGIHEEKPLKWTKHDELVRKEAISCLKHWRNCIPTIWNEDYKNILMWLENELSVHTEKQSDKPQGKSALEAIKEKKVDNANKVEPKFKVKYAGGIYNLLEVQHASDVTYYGIEYKPNHIYYVLSDKCEII